MKKIYILFIFLNISAIVWAQEEVYNTFKSTHVINSHSTKMLKAHETDIRIGHRFGDLAGDNGGWGTFFGIENAQDILIGFEYGITDKLNIALNRTKGAGALKQLINGQVKYKLMQQTTDNSKPVSLVLMAGSSISTMPAGETPNTLITFEKTSHRMSYVAQGIIARKFSDRFSLQLMPTYVHRNLVDYNDQNDLFSLGFATRIQMSKLLGLIVEGFVPFSELRTAENGYYPSIGLGLEIDTGGHIFQVNFTNARAMTETDFIPNTQSNWADGQFRLGFTISRLFKL